MTEFYNIGKHCDHPTCHQKDFLPFECELCKHNYCLDHRDLADHNCSAIHQQLMESTIPICPLCDKPISKLSPLEDNNLVIMRHWEAGQCPKYGSKLSTKHITHKQETCKHDKCTEHKVLTHCKTCNQKFCLSHRLETDHQCKKIPQQKPMNQVLGQLHRDRAVKDLYSSVPKAPVVSKKTLVQKRRPTDSVEFTNTWREAVMPGLNKPNLENEDKLYAHVYFPYQSYIQPVRLFFDNKWSVGKVVDLLADFVKVPNHNSKLPFDSNERLNLYLFNGQEMIQLNNSAKISDLVNSGVLRNKESVIVLERGPSGQNLRMSYENCESLVREMRAGRCSTSFNINLVKIESYSKPISV
jgi:predicted nucleic acid binding AN1-type Zn finger protein